MKLLYEKGCFTKAEYDKIYLPESKPGNLYCSAKVHKPAIDKCPRFFPILSAITTPSYNLAKFLIPILSPLIEDEFTVQGSFSNEIIDLNYNYLMTSLDVESLF